MKWPRAAAIFAVIAVTGAVGVRVWMDPQDHSVEVREMPTHTVEDSLRTVRPPVTDLVDAHERVVTESGVSHIGDPLDPDADFVLQDAEIQHVGGFLDADAEYRIDLEVDAVHIGIPRDPDDDWRPPPNDGVRHVGEPSGPDFPPERDESALHIGEYLEPPVEE